MYNFDSTTLKMFLSEEKTFLLGARIQKIQQPTRRELLFTLRNNGETRKFYINISPKEYHLCLITPDTEALREIKIPKAPPMFCMLLRKYLEAARIAKVEQPQGERILEFYFEVFNEFGEKIYLCLAVELMGKHSNVVLYNHDTNVIIGCAHNVGSDKSRKRELFGGLPYAYPSKHGLKTDLSEVKTFYSEVLKFSEKPVNAAIDEAFAAAQAAETAKTKAEKLLTQNAKKLKKLNSTIEKIEKELSKCGKADKYKHFGDMIMANLFAEKDFSPSIFVTDWETNEEISIKLDETKTLKQNAQNYFKLYTKTKTKREKLSELLKTLNSERAEIEVEKGHETIVSVEKNRAPLPEMLVIDGFKVFVGKNDKQNDLIVSKLSTEADLWFHVKGCAGSHVLLKGKNPPAEVILECAKLAKANSKAKDGSKVAVIYTQRKHLKKPPRAAKGYVTYTNEREILI